MAACIKSTWSPEGGHHPITLKGELLTILTLSAEAEEEEGESEKEEEDIFALEGETEHLHLSSPGEAPSAADQERIQGRGGWEGAARGVLFIL